MVTLLNIQRRSALRSLHRLKAALRKQIMLRRDIHRLEPTLRSELYGAEQMELYGASLAIRHHASQRVKANTLLARLADNEAILSRAYEMLTRSLKDGLRITPAGEWLLDNFYLIEEQIRIAQKHFPKGYSHELPHLRSGPSAGLPRVYDIALETICHSDGRVDSEGLRRFVTSYQTVSPLTLGELWAIPIMLRLALIDNLRRVAMRVMTHWHDRKLADEWANIMTDIAERDPKNVVLAVADMARSDPPMASSFVAELTRRLQGQGSALALPLTWIEQRLSESGLSVEHLVQLEAQQQAADQVSIGNSIGSLRTLSAMNWRDFVEGTSSVEKILREDPSRIYAAMDFETRDRYRHAVEALSKYSGHHETEVARAAVELARGGVEQGATQSHVGFYLVDKGAATLERNIVARVPFAQRLQRLILAAPLEIYLGLTALLTLLFARPLILGIGRNGMHGWLAALIAIPTVLVISQLATGVVNWLATIALTPQMLPRMDFSEGVPAEARTLVVVPSLFSSFQDIDELVESLEVRFLANRDEHIHFCLLTDFTDAPTETLEQDAALLLFARQRVDALNAAYPNAIADRFFLLHRPRRWNAADKIWMGFERKRGKLTELNALLRGIGRERFLLVVGRSEILTEIKYVITLDADTQLPRDSARLFIGAMAHPLNRAVYDPRKRRIVSGYAILQPRVGISLPSASRSSYARIFGSDAGIDPYTRTISDVYQDLFREGSFIGKGIYDVDAFEQAIAGRFPDNSILSHDLLEGCYARSGLISDIQLYEEYPSRYDADVKRRRRWIRGDWQLLPWLLPWVPLQGKRRERNPLTALSHWKIIDNLRRSLVPPSLIILLLIGWASVSRVTLWTVAVLAVVLVPPFLASLLDLLRKPSEMMLGQHLHGVMYSIGQHFVRALLALVWLPHEALYSLEAIVRTLWRVIISRRRLLQWNPSREVGRAVANDLVALLRSMWIGPLLAVTILVVLGWRRPDTLAIAGPLLLLWLASPVVAWWISKPPLFSVFTPSPNEQRFLRRLSRRTWAFFEAHIGPQENWLPPDNMQEQPEIVIAHRTSPTNMGLALLGNLAAYDLGYLTAARLVDRTAAALQTMQGMETYRGHFYNWYDTRSLEPLRPRYVSAVDSGNLAGHLLTLRSGLLALPDEPVCDERIFEGLHDTLGLLREAVAAEQPENADTLLAIVTELDAVIATPPGTLKVAADSVHEVLDRAERVAIGLGGVVDGDVGFWLQLLLVQCRDASAYLSAFAGLSDARGGQGGIPTLRQVAEMPVDEENAAAQAPVAAAKRRAIELILALTRLAQQAAERAEMDYEFLYDPHRHLLSIGYNVDERRLDAGFYDLLASEARLTNFVAISQQKLPQESWFTLGRLLTNVGGEPVLLSWTGSMFEYLMPLLVMPSYEGTLLHQTCRTVVDRQIEYGSQLNIPWGISESGYNARDIHFNYQYRAFGVPGLGLKRGLGEELVVAPYASALALMVAPEEACANLQRLSGEGLEGRFGLYEAVDYTPARLPRGQNSAVIYSFMAHHQGMSLLALSYVLRRQPMQKRFEADPGFQATLLLLQERVPRIAAEYQHVAGLASLAAPALAPEPPLRVFTEPNRTEPAVQLLSNGRYHVMVSSAGGGYSRHRDMAVTRWREDISSDNWGTFCYLRDVASGDFWSCAYQPTLKKTEFYEAIFSDARAEFRVRERDFVAHTEIVVSPEDDIELRRVRINNRGRTERVIEITSYAEVVLAPPMTDAVHPAFSNLFVQAELVRAMQAIVCTRRPRSSQEKSPWMCHLLAVHDAHIDEISYETDRARFIGRGRSAASPQVMDGADASRHLSDSEGSVLDPIVAIRCRITLQPEQSAVVDLVTGIGDSRDACMHLVEKYRDRHLADRVFDLAWTHSQVLLRQLNAGLADAQLYERMATSIIYANASLRADASILLANRRGQSGLWGQAISGDLPIVLLHIAELANIDLVRQLVQAHAYWRLKGLAVDLVIWNEDRAGYRQQLQDMIMGLIASGVEASLLDRPGGIFVRPAQQISQEDRILVQAAARLIIDDSRGSLAEQVNRRRVRSSPVPFTPTAGRFAFAADSASVATEQPAAPLLLSNRYGGFSADGTEYVIVLKAGEATPAPWVNVLANAQFGTVVSESGSAYTWGENAHEFRLTPWQNDPVTDSCGEAIYLRDEETGYYWSPTPLPCRGKGAYVTRHGFGYSVYEHTEEGVRTELWVYVSLDSAVKLSVLKVSNVSGRTRRLSATGYVEWVLGELRSKTAMHVVTESDPTTGALFARNAYSTDFPGRVAFFDVDNPARTVSCDRSEFLGRNNSLRAPAAMLQARLSGRVGAGLDPCGAIQLGFDLDDGDEQEIIFRLGMASDTKAASTMVQRFRGRGTAANTLEAIRAHWHWTLGKVQVQTPDPTINVLANGWLMYQVIACRFLARSGYYQSSGAYGFRDQLQDSMAMTHASSYSSRQHLLLCAAHQFVEGDVQHWWHPPLGHGVRTRCSDDYLWLPLATSRHVVTTGDHGVLDEMVGYLEGRQVGPDEESYYDVPARSGLRETLYQHCVRAIERSMPRGSHGLPLMGSGDWNDGMNRVGEHGKGESVWLGFFLYDVLVQFAPVARLHADEAFAERCEAEAATLRANIERHGWDGAWYRRAYFDDGTPLGSATNEECQIDSIAQSWSVLSGAGDAERQHQAMDSLDRHLVRRDVGLVQLLEPPFDKSTLDPGYIKGYVPGVRENGGQYTHAAIWATMAFAKLGDSQRAWELLRMINPINHCLTAEAVDIYKVEPYVVAADVYGVAPHTGRGGWSWYTGSAGWMYRLIVESLLGLQLEDEHLYIRPLLPSAWRSFTMDYRFRETDYHIAILQEESLEPGDQVILDGKAQAEQGIALVDDGKEHRIEFRRRFTPQGHAGGITL